MSDLECPYCESIVKPNEDLREPNEPIEAECEKCGKSFVYYIEYYPSYTSHQSACLNGGEHDWVASVGLPDDWPLIYLRCSMCGSQRVVKKEGAK